MMGTTIDRFIYLLGLVLWIELSEGSEVSFHHFISDVGGFTEGWFFVEIFVVGRAKALDISWFEELAIHFTLSDKELFLQRLA